MDGYYYAIHKEKTVIIKYLSGDITMCGIKRIYIKQDFDDIDFESCIHFL